MSDWQSYPASYRHTEVDAILRTVRAGESINLVGLSGAGKSNLLGFLANRWPLPGQTDDIAFYFLDCNALPDHDTLTLLERLRILLGEDTSDPEANALSSIHQRLDSLLSSGDKKICLLLDRYELIEQADPFAASNNLRALRDRHKYRLTYLFATRRPLGHRSELAELVYANTIWLGPLSPSDAKWNVERYARRRGAAWPENVGARLIELSWGYPSLLRALCEAYAQLETLDSTELSSHPAVLFRVREFWADQPAEDHLKNVGLGGHPLLEKARFPRFDTSELTAKEHTLLLYLQEHAGEVCEKDDLIKAVWPEDAVYEDGVRDDSLAQLVRRLRIKIEPDPSNPRFIHTVPGRGYHFKV